MTFTRILISLPAAFLVPVIHEWVKARVSNALGDRTPKHNGFITWNPFKFFEPVGFIFMLIYGVGWGQPVTTSPFYYKDKRKGILLTYITPMIVSLLIGVLTVTVMNIAFVPLMVVAVRHYTDGGFNLIYKAIIHFYGAVYIFGQFNITLALFNLIPIYPLAMSKIIHVFVSPETSMRLNNYEKPLQVVLVFLLILNVHEWTIVPVADLIINLVSF